MCFVVVMWGCYVMLWEGMGFVEYVYMLVSGYEKSLLNGGFFKECGNVGISGVDLWVILWFGEWLMMNWLCLNCWWLWYVFDWL